MANEFKVKKGLIVQGSGSVGDNTILDVQGNQGQLFSITDSLSGSLFSVGDISGIPILEVFSNEIVKIGTFGSEGIIVNGSNVTASGNISASGLLFISASQNVGQTYGVLVRDPSTGRVYHTGSYGEGGGGFTAAGISGSLGTNATLIRTLTAAGISGSFTAASSSISTRLTNAETELAGTLLSSSVQIALDISGSLGTNATLIRTLTAAGISGSLGSNATLIRTLTAAGISGSWQGQNFISASQTFLSTGQRSGNSVITGSLFLVGSSGHLTASANISASGTITANYFTGTLTAPTAPTSLALSIVDDTINVTFSASATAEISHYEIHASDNGGTYGLISTITPDDFAASMSIIDDTFILSGTQAYRVFAVKNGVFSTALAGSISFSAGTLDVVNMVVVPTLNTFQIKWDPPSLGARFVTAYNVTKHEHAVQASLSEASATQIYSGLNTSFTYQINGIDNNNFHQFWISTTVA
jgi:hypothetical protein